MIGNDSGAKRSEQTPIYTLAQFNTRVKGKESAKGVFVNGKGVDIGAKTQLKNWSRKKMISQSLILKLIEVANAEGNFTAAQSYRNTFYCCSKFHSDGTRLFGKYCKNRFCPLCSGIRKAKIINQLMPEISKWKEPYFITLTSQTVTKDKLKQRIKDYYQILQAIQNKYSVQFQRGRGHKLVGIRALECTYNPVKDWFHPHFHLILKDQRTAILIYQEWVLRVRKKWGKYAINEDAQNIQKIRSIERTMIEIIKYSTKIFTEKELIKKTKIAPEIYLTAYHHIINAMKGRRIFEKFGFKVSACEKEVKGAKIIFDFEEWFYSSAKNDWIDNKGVNLLSGYRPAKELITLLNTKINV